jgi:hypothetical protein
MEVIEQTIWYEKLTYYYCELLKVKMEVIEQTIFKIIHIFKYKLNIEELLNRVLLLIKLKKYLHSALLNKRLF